MLQPRLSGAGVRKMGLSRARGCALAACLAILLSVASCQELNSQEGDSLDGARTKREYGPENRDLTVLLVNDQNRDYNTRVGRYHSVKPVIGLLTATARTFIQDGVTTEFATQILGTTLNNGRIYAQLLTKSSLVLYNKPSNVDDLVKPTRSAFDGQWSVKKDLGYIDPDKFVLKNTDYLEPNSKMDIVYASKPADNLKYWSSPTSADNISENQILEEPVGRKVPTVDEIPRFEIHNLLDESSSQNSYYVKPSIIENVNTLHRNSKPYDVPDPVFIETRIKEEFNESNVVKVKPNHELPTFTIKNEFSPIFYYIDNVESRGSNPQSSHQTKSPKKLFGQKSEPRPKKTFTYAGFADFTTVVGDTVIIFTPNTDTVRDPVPGQVNVFPPVKRPDKLATKITFLAADIPVATSTYKAHDHSSPTRLPQKPSQSDENRSEKALYNDEESLKKVLYEVDKMPDSISVQYNHGFDLNLDVIQPSEASITTTESTRLTDDLEVIPIQGYNSKATDPLLTISPSATILESSKESVITEKDDQDKYNNSEEEDDNTAAEVTEKGDDENNTTDEYDEALMTTANDSDEESYEETDETTGGKEENEEQQEICTKGIETLSTMTTAYKTLTYLTTYFIPLEGSETTTSIKSEVVVESDVGYLTNVVCKTDTQIEPTAVLSIEIKSSIHSSLEQPEIERNTEREQSVPTELNNDETVTESMPKTTQSGKQVTVQEDRVTTSFENSSINTEENEKEVTTIITTENGVTTSQRSEVSISTEHSTTPGSTTPDSEETSQEIDSSENEVDLIYKTLYTTYTYFTTFFGDSTSSVASHKSVVTNIITSTINFSNMDPSLLGAFNEDEIAPTSVGIGRPTESYAINSIIDLVKNKDVLESVQIDERYSSQTPTPALDDDLVSSIKPDAVKTYYTTYTFFTTIYVGNDANVCSRREVYTNYVGPDSLVPTKTNLVVEASKAQFDFRNCKQVKKTEEMKKSKESSSIESSVTVEEKDDISQNEENTPNPSPVEVEMLLSVDAKPIESESSFVTDVKSSSSKGEQKYIENNNILEDQISSESNIEEIIPSPTLLLQTSYTTFTYFTTMYIGKDSSKIKSRLETITNVVTETITPKKEPEVEESNLPITYYTTFTYWTTLYKDKSTTITSREEIVSNVVTPVVQVAPTVSPIDTTPIDVDTVLPPKQLEIELKPSAVGDNLEQDDGKATFYTTYTYFTTFYVGNTSQIRSSLETVTNIVDNTKVIDDNQLARKVQSGSGGNNLVQDKGEKQKIAPSVVKEEIIATKLPSLASGSPISLSGTYIDNLFAEVKPKEENNEKQTVTPETEKNILFSQVAVISGDSVIVTNDNKTLKSESASATTPKSTLISPTPEVIESSEPDTEVTTESKQESDDEDDGSNTRKKSRLTFTTKKPSFTPVIRPFASRNRPTFSPKRVPLSSGATTITRSDFTPTITATPTLKSVRPTGFGGNRKASSFAGPSSSVRRFTGRSSVSNLASNAPSASRAGGFGRGSIQPTSRRVGYRSSSLRSNSVDFSSRSSIPKIKPTATSRLRSGRQSASVSLSPIDDQNETETSETQAEETATESLEEVSEAPARTSTNPLLRFRRPLVTRQPGTGITSRSTTPGTTRKAPVTRGRITTTTRRTTTRPTTNPLLSLRRQRPNALFPKRNLFKQPEPEPEEEIKENEQNVDNQNEDDLEGEEYEGDNEYESSDKKEQQVATPATQAPRRASNAVSIRPFRGRRVKRQSDYGNRKYSNFRRPGARTLPNNRRSDPEPETEAPTTTQKPRSRFSSRTTNLRTTTSSSVGRATQRQPFIVRGESRTTTSSPAYRLRNTRPSTRTTTSSSRAKLPRYNSNFNSQTTSRSNTRNTGRSRIRGNTRTNTRQRNSYENTSGERLNFNHIVNDGKITVTHQIPIEVTIPIVNGKITEYKNVLTAKPSLQTLLQNQVSTSLGPLGNQQLVLVNEATELGDNGATKVIKFILHETPTQTVVFTPTTIRGRKTSYSHILPSTVYNVEPVTSTLTPEISANVPLANLLLSQLLLGNQQPAINPLLAYQQQGILPQQIQQNVAQTPVTEYKTRTTTYVTTVTDNRETVLPITFRGIPILTTIKDPTVNVITATEFITDTLVTTPTAYPLQQQQPQFNSLLLPFLLQQQQQQQQQALQTANPLLGLAQPDLSLVQSNNINDLFNNSPKPNDLTDLISNEEYAEDDQTYEESGEEVVAPPPPPSRTRNRPAKPSPPKLTSVVTLYVSGRTPGEFSTVLSTVISDDTQNVRKREAIFYDDVKLLPSILPSIEEILSSQAENALENSVVSDKFANIPADSQVETQSLESIVGELSKHIKYDASPTQIIKIVRASALSEDSMSVDGAS